MGWIFLASLVTDLLSGVEFFGSGPECYKLTD